MVRPIRPLTPDEIQQLERQGCQATDWGAIRVAEGFTPTGIERSRLEGAVHLGRCCRVVDSLLVARGEAIEVLSETGARPVVAALGMSPALFYVQAHRRYAGDLVERIQHVVRPRSSTCIVDDFAVVERATLHNCYVGRSVRVDDGFSAEQSVLLTSSHLSKGEACALLAGPFTVSHHKSTLLIACQTAFFNAGSGSNQSNHSYKLGANKFGIMERGAKLGSSSYLFWPARVGAYSTVLGHHSAHFDLAPLPFSYIIEEDGRTVVIPAAALRSIGTYRDELKWVRRESDNLADDDYCPLTIKTLNPFTAGRIVEGLAILRGMQDEEPATVTDTFGVNRKYYRYGDCLVPSRAVGKGIDIYREALLRYGVGLWLERLSEGPLEADSDSGTGTWVDYLGYVLPKAATEAALDAAATTTASLDDLNAVFARRTDGDEWRWASSMLQSEFGIDPATATSDSLRDIVDRYKFAVRHHRRTLLFDIDKEFNQEARMLYGIDGDDADRERDFAVSVGAAQDDPTTQAIEADTEAAVAQADAVLQRLGSTL